MGRGFFASTHAVRPSIVRRKTYHALKRSNIISHSPINLMHEPARKIFPDKAKLFDEGKCTNCKKVVTEQPPFRNSQSKDEYEISGFCQPCQDDFFGK